MASGAAAGIDMAITPPVSADCTCADVWRLLEHLYGKGGIGVLCFIFTALIFYKLVWKVWKAAMRGKDVEIERLVGEKNYLQARLFRDRGTSG